MNRGEKAFLLELKDVTKVFGGTPALKRVSFRIEPGSVVGLIGENGAGKSTLIKILSGVHQPSGGVISWEGEPVSLLNPRQALEMGIATIHQELSYFEKQTVAENLCLGEPWPRYFWGGVNWCELFRRAGDRLRQFQLDIDPRAFFQDLSPAQRQEVAMVRALSQRARLLILDEPTASLTEPEVERLMEHLQRLQREGMTVIYVSHRLDEILRITDRVLVLRDGELVADYPTAEADVQRMVKDMVGRSLAPSKRAEAEAVRGKMALRVEGLSREGLFSDISLSLHEGEILGLAGLVGAGRSELARCLYGLYPPDEGTMWLHGKKWEPRTPSEAVEQGLIYVPEERKRQGFVLEHSVRESVSIGFLRRIGRGGLISGRAERRAVQSVIRGMGIKTRTEEQPIGTLSGGNQQKALLGRWLENDPAVIILDEPTRGVDVGAKAEIHKLIQSLAKRGKAILLISSDLPEILSLSHRVLVLHQGRLAAELHGSEMNQEKVLMAASGMAIA